MMYVRLRWLGFLLIFFTLIQSTLVATTVVLGDIREEEDVSGRARACKLSSLVNTVKTEFLAIDRLERSWLLHPYQELIKDMVAAASVLTVDTDGDTIRRHMYLPMPILTTLMLVISRTMPVEASVYAKYSRLFYDHLFRADQALIMLLQFK